MPPLLRLVALAGAMVTIDAMGGQKAMAKTRTAQGAEDVLARKAPPPTLHGEGHLWGEDGKADRLAPVTSAPHTTTDADHGRLETRHDWGGIEIIYYRC